MKKLFSGIVVLLLFSKSLNSQLQGSFKLMPQNLMHPVHSMLPISLELRKSKLGVEFEYGIQTPDIFFNWNYYRNKYRYSKSQISLRYYFAESSRIGYFGILSSYIPASYTIYDSWYEKDNHFYTYESSYIKRRYLRFAVYAGASTISYGRIFIEGNMGFGINTRFVFHYAVNVEEVEISPGFTGSYHTPEQSEGVTNHLFLIYNLRIGFKMFERSPKKL